MAAPTLLVLDVDGTLVPADGGSTPSEAALAALEATPHDVILALASGRTEPDLRKVAEPLGIDDFVCELGGLVVVGGRAEPVVDLGEADPAEAIRDCGVLEAIADVDPDLAVDPYGHRVTVPLHGPLDAGDVDRIRGIVAGYDGFELLDNTVAGRTVVLHVAPEGVGKTAGLARLQDRLGVAPEDTVVVGDSPQDAGCSTRASRVYIVANGTVGDAEADNVVWLDGEDGEGVGEAVDAEFGG